MFTRFEFTNKILPMKKFILILSILALSFYSQAQKLFPAKQKAKSGFIDANGNWVIAPKFEVVDIFSDGLARVMIAHQWGYINEKGEMVIPLKFEKTKNFADGMARVKVDGNYGVIDKQGNWLVRPVFKNIERF